MSACPHHWTVTSECPKCLRAELDATEAERDRLRAEIRHVIEDCRMAVQTDSEYKKANWLRNILARCEKTLEVKP